MKTKKYHGFEEMIKLAKNYVEEKKMNMDERDSLNQTILSNARKKKALIRMNNPTELQNQGKHIILYKVVAPIGFKAADIVAIKSTYAKNS